MIQKDHMEVYDKKQMNVSEMLQQQFRESEMNRDFVEVLMVVWD